MAKSKRKCVEDEIVKAMLVRLKPLGFSLVDKNPSMFEKQVGNVKWGFQFYLTGTNYWSSFCKAQVVYTDLTQIIEGLLSDTELENSFENGVGNWQDELRIIEASGSLKIASIEDVEDFTNSFFCRINEIEQKYWIPQSDPKIQMEGFKKLPGHWINSDLAQNIVLWVTHGLQTNNADEIKFGIERGEYILQNTNYKSVTSMRLIDILKDKLGQYLC